MTIKERSTKVYHQKRMFSKEELTERESCCIYEEPPYCNAACPLKLDVKAMVKSAADGNFSAALAVYKKITPLPHILASGCEAPCREKCKLCGIGDGINIPMLEQAVMRFGVRPKSLKMFRLRKKKKAAVFGSDLFTAFYTGEMTGKSYPLTIYSEYETISAMLKAIAPMAGAEAAEQDAAVLAAMDIQFITNVSLTPEFIEEERQKYDIVCAASKIMNRMGDTADGTIMLCRASNIISYPDSSQGVLDAAFGAKKAALTADRLAQGLSPDNTRGEEGSVETRLYTNMDGIAGSASVSCKNGFYTKQQAVSEAGRCIQCHCDECIKGCVYLQHYKKYPKKLTREIYNNVSIIMGDHMMNRPINACSLCGQCSVTCPNGYNMAEICLLARRNMVTTDKMPLAPHEFALMDMEFSNTEAYLCRLQPGFDTCKYVFFPGCQASAIAPEIVRAAYLDLSCRLSGGVALLLGCCGVIADWAGRYTIYDETVKQLDDSLVKLGNPTIIAGCPTCAGTLAKHEGVRVVGIWDVLDTIGLPKGTGKFDRPAVMHDSCGARGDAHTQQTIRRLAAQLGCELIDTDYSGDRSPCCGYGGLVMYANRNVAHEMARMCVDRSDAAFITYCMACRDRFAREGKESRHILELIYGIDAGSPPDISEKRYNRLTLKKQMLKEVWKENMPEIQCGFDVSYTPEARRMMDDRMILTSDVIHVLEYVRKTGEAIQDAETGLLISCCREGNVTFWVKYVKVRDGYLVHSAYSHRMDVEQR